MVCVTLSCIFITKTTFYVTVKSLLCCTVLIFVNCRRHLLHVKLDCMTALRWHSITGSAAVIPLVCNSCCARSGYHVYGLHFHLSSLQFTVSNSLTVCVVTAFVHVRSYSILILLKATCWSLTFVPPVSSTLEIWSAKLLFLISFLQVSQYILVALWSAGLFSPETSNFCFPSWCLKHLRQASKKKTSFITPICSLLTKTALVSQFLYWISTQISHIRFHQTALM